MKKTIEDLLKLDQLEFWQKKMLLSFKSQVEKNRNLSERRVQVIHSIRDQFDPDSVKEWASEFDDQKRESFRVCIEYYASTGYFSYIVSKYRKDKEYIPTKKEYNKICENKYSKKVLEQHFAKPKFRTGQIAQIRSDSSVGWKNLQKLNGSYATKKICNSYVTILKSEAMPIMRAATGAKVYQVLFFGSTKVMYVHESDLKKAKGVPK